MQSLSSPADALLTSWTHDLPVHGTRTFENVPTPGTLTVLCRLDDELFDLSEFAPEEDLTPAKRMTFWRRSSGFCVLSQQSGRKVHEVARTDRSIEGTRTLAWVWVLEQFALSGKLDAWVQSLRDAKHTP